MVKLFSLRSFIVYFNFLVIPVILCCAWLLLPTHTYVAFSGTSMAYFVFVFFTWISFYDLNLPGVSKIQILVFFALFIGLSIGWLHIVIDLDKESNRLAYSFIDAIVFVFCAICYLIHIIVYKMKKILVFRDEPILDADGRRRRKQRSRPWTKRISRIFCYYRVIDMDDADTIRQFTFGAATLPKKGKNSSLTSSVDPNNNSNDLTSSQSSINIDGPKRDLTSSIEIADDITHNEAGDGLQMSTFSSNQPIVHLDNQSNVNNISIVAYDGNNNNNNGNGNEYLKNSDFKQNFTQSEGKKKPDYKVRTQTMVIENPIDLMPKYEISYRNYFSVVFYQLFVIGTWFWLHSFTTLIRENELFSTKIWALISICIFQASRVVLMGISNALNRLLKPKELKYFTLFQFPLMFFLYYRSLFLNTNDWSIVVLVSFVIFFIDVVYYPLHMTKRFWYFRHQVLLPYVDKKRTTSRIFAFVRILLAEENPSYDRHVMNLSIEYYYDKMAEYISIITMVAFLSIIRALKWKREYFKYIAQIEDNTFYQLLYRYLYLLGFEFSYDLAVRFASRRWLKIDISNRGRNETISHYGTRFIFALFVLYDLLDVYNVQLFPPSATSTSSG
ncbi:hypothetical protein CYY_004571 [Polysphondylium violaceum]|uniref:Transmembrane protein n=1 Tax=Polysphondylium violaceum TaxID=133409 RepID=A0A8J4V7N1_9MYCE|nr:hypothetical protein CYY_004571 [Polysphondylium violaceum]